MALLDRQTRSNATDWYRSRSHQPLRIDCTTPLVRTSVLIHSRLSRCLPELKTGHHDLEMAARCGIRTES